MFFYFVVWIAACFGLALVNFAEAAISSLSSARLKSLKALMGQPFWQAARRWISHPAEYLTLLLLLQNLLEAVYAWSLILFSACFIETPQGRNIAAWLGGTVFNLFVLNLYPKVWARRLAAGRIGAWILRGLYIVLVPFYPFLHLFFYGLGRVVNPREDPYGATLGRGLALSLEELRELVDLTQAASGGRGDLGVHRPWAATGSPSATDPARDALGVHRTPVRSGPLGAGGADPALPQSMERKETWAMLANFLRLQEVTARDIMTPRDAVSYVREEVLLAESPGPDRERALFSLFTDGHTRTIILKAGEPAGYIHAKDLLKLVAGDPQDLYRQSVGRQMIRYLEHLSGQRSVLDVMPSFFHDTSIAAVYDEAGVWIGILTAEDILEEITGEILDEFESRKRGSRARRAPHAR